MIKTGIDVIQISRVADKINKNAGFLDIILTEKEKQYCKTKVGQVTDDMKRFQSIAGIYAVKEAFFKALGRGIKSLSEFQSVEVLHTEDGQPILEIVDTQKLSIYPDKFKDISISISHDGNIAMAICVIEI